MQDRTFTYHETWHNIIQALAPELRLELADAITSYAFGGVEMDMSPVALAIFAPIRQSIDAQQRKRHAVSEARRKAGSSHKGNQYSKNGTNVPKMEQNGTNVPKSLTISTIGTNVPISTPKLEQNGTNGTFVPKMLKTNDLEKKSEENANFPPTPPLLYNNIIDVVDKACASAYARMREWLADNEQTLQIMAARNGLTSASQGKEQLLELLDPYIRKFVEPEAVREDIAQGYRREVKAHFENWLRIHIERTNEQQQTTANHRVGTKTTSKSATEPDYFKV